VSPSDPDARIAKMKDGTTHLAHKAEHAVDMESGAVIAVTLQAADQGDTTTIQETLAETAGNLAHLIEREAEKAPDEEPQVSLDPLAEITTLHRSQSRLWKPRPMSALRPVKAASCGKRTGTRADPRSPADKPTISIAPVQEEDRAGHCARCSCARREGGIPKRGWDSVE
jgi:hypothetical protein